MCEIDDLPALQEAVLQDIKLFQTRLPEWHRGGAYADHLRPLDPLERREAERLDRLLRQERAAAGERARERVARERARPWSEDERWTLRKRVWRERRDRERELLEQREQTLLRREQELARLRAQCERWLADIQQLEPAARDWCDEQIRLSDEIGLTPDLIDRIHQRRRQAAERHAQELLARADVRAAIEPALGPAERDPLTMGAAIAPPLAALGGESGAVRQPVVLAALALLIARRKQ
jgi:hypothetical protein